jgi:tetratricopeptide (TPR) repeat protein
MIGKLRTIAVSSGLACLLAWTGSAQTQGSAPAAAAQPGDKGVAYYNFAMGHMYAELAATYGYRSEYVDKAIEHYKAALKADPGAASISEELTDLYIQAGKLNEAVSEAKEMLKRDPENLDARRMLGRIYSRLIGEQNRINETMLRQAIEQYQKIVEKDPQDVDSWLMLGRLYKISQNSADSEKAYKKALELDPDNEFALSGLALVYGDLGDAKGALDMLRKLADQNPSAGHLRALAKAFEDNHDYKSAAQTLTRALEQSPRDLELKSELAEDLLLSEQGEEALKLYTELEASDPRNPRIPLRISQIYLQRRDFAKAREAQQKALEIDPDNLEVRYNDVNLLEAEGKYPESIAKLKEIIDTTAKKSYSASEQNSRAMLLERLGQLYRATEQYDQAVEAFRQIPQVDPDKEAVADAQIVDTYRQAKEFNKAEQEAAAAAKKFPDNRALKLVRASLLADMGKTEEAAAATRQLLDGKNDRETYLALAQVYDKGRKFSEMASALDSAEKLSDSNDDKEGVFFMRGAMYEKQNKVELAEAEFRKVLDLNPDNASALNYLGYMLADRNMRLTEAQKLIGKALELEPNNGAYLDSLGWVKFRLGRFDEAENYLRQALGMPGVSKDPTVHDHLGDVYLQQGKLKDAIAQWEISLKQANAGSSDIEPSEVAKIHKKLETARVRLARESSSQISPR